MILQVVLGLGFGDEGKGSIVDWLARRATTPPLIVRWNGGPQAAHHVVTDDGRDHCFAQLGSGSFVDGARTHLGPEMAVDLYALQREAAVFGGDVLARVTIDPRCVVVTPWHAILGRVREALRGSARHGSTGRGIAEAKLGIARITGLVTADLGRGFDHRVSELRAALLACATALVDAAPAGTPQAARDEALSWIARGEELDLLDRFRDAAQRPWPITSTLPAADHVILESAQGALLDRDHGFFPHVTPSRITRAAAEHAAAQLGLPGKLQVWGVLRAYHTRHGEGPFPSQDSALAELLPERHNRDDGPAGRFRVGWFDAVLARYAVSFAGPIDRLAITCLDRVAALTDPAIVESWRGPGGELVDRVDTASASSAVPLLRATASICDAIEHALGRPIDVQSWGPTASAKRERADENYLSRP
jgi:adenylosuccinate synthase